MADFPSIRLQNLRGLSDTGFVELKPVTVLVGRNSSGKSTFLRALPLLRQSVERDTMGPVLWSGRLVDFGSFETAVQRGEKEVVVSFRIAAPLRTSAYDVVHDGWLLTRRSGRAPGSVDLDVSVRLQAMGRDQQTVAVGCSLQVGEDHVELAFDQDRLSTLVVNGGDRLADAGPHARAPRAPGASFVPQIAPRPDESAPHPFRDAFLGTIEARDPHQLWDARFTTGRHLGGSAKERIAEALSSYAPDPTAYAEVYRAALQVRFGSADQVLESLREATSEEGWTAPRLSARSKLYKRVKDLALIDALPGLLRGADESVTQLARSVTYSEPLRAAAERYYRKQDLAVSEIESDGTNFAMYLRSLTDAERSDFRAWTREHLGMDVVASSIPSHVMLEVELEDGVRVNMADIGFGYSQVLPVAAQVWDRTSGRRRRRRGVPGRREGVVFAIEQPELHLHPALQVRVADLLVKTVAAARSAEVPVSFVVETHSPVIIDRIGQLVADGSYLGAADAQVLLFELESRDAAAVRRASYDADGVLRDWPHGFFEPDLLGVEA